MDKHEMTSGVIPLRHSSLPGHIKLPRRYEKAAMGTNGIPARVRKISIQPGQSALGDSLSDRLDDLMGAFMWVKQELIMLRQHDILLKRQFFNIQHSIQSLRKTTNITTTSITTTNSINTTATNTTTTTSSTTPTTSTFVTNSEASPISNGIGGGGDSKVEMTDDVFNSVHDILNDCEFSMDRVFVRQACSVTMLHEDSEEEGEEDGGGMGEEFFRPRTSSMKTSRDMAALARRRGSKELI